MHRPTRKVRQFVKRSGKGKGGGKGWSRFSFLAQMPEQEYDEVFYGGKGASKGKRRSFGKGKGRKGNPRGRDGEIMKCSQKLPNGTVCGSESHFRAQCPHNTEKGGGKGSGASGFGAYVEAGPIGDIIGTWAGMVLPDDDEHDVQDAHSVPSGSAASTDERPRGQWARDAPTAAAMPQLSCPYIP